MLQSAAWLDVSKLQRAEMAGSSRPYEPVVIQANNQEVAR